MPDELTIEDLEKHSGLSTRTLHYYMQIGLLPGPKKRGKYASYTQEHLDRLDLILILKEMHLPLKEIRAVLDRLTPSEIIRYLDDQEDLLYKIKDVKPDPEEKGKTKAHSSGLDYIKTLEDAHTTTRDIAEKQPHMYQKDQFKLFSDAAAANQSQDEPEPKQEIWRRIVLEDGVELNIRDTRDKDRRYKIDRLLKFARSLFEK